MKSLVTIAFFSLGLSFHMACVPSFLDKYKREEVRASSAKSGASPLTAQGSPAPASPSRPGRSLASITQIGEGLFRVPMTYDRAWDTMVDVLLRNYNLQIVDKNTGILTTEWDSYYLDGKVHRNKVSMRLKRVGNQGVDLTVHNNVEVLSRVPEGLSEVWLPSDRNKAEVGRIIQNLAIASGQPKPKLAADWMPTGEAPKSTL